MKFNINFFKKRTFLRQSHAKTSVQKLLNPTREWATGLVSTGVIFIIFAGYIGYDFYIQYEGVESATPVEESIVVYRQKDVAAILETYQNREKEFMRLRGIRPQQIIIPVPSNEDATSTEMEIPLAE